ncbi:MAG: hypothetical protein HKN43_10575 [Rhodothermales bacterium]|nr:hypothetical protein [Rhodothermales bacterium]
MTPLSQRYRISAVLLAALLFAAGPISRIGHACMMSAMTEMQAKGCGDSDHASPPNVNAADVEVILASQGSDCCPELSATLSAVTQAVTLHSSELGAGVQIFISVIPPQSHTTASPPGILSAQHSGLAYPLFITTSSFLI